MSKDKTRLSFALGFALLLIPGVMYFIPLDWLRSQHSVCLFKNLTGHECYGCGMTRAMFSVIHLHFREAFQYNRLFPVVFPLLVYIWAKTILSLLQAKQIINRFLKGWHLDKKLRQSPLGSQARQSIGQAVIIADITTEHNKQKT